MSFMIHVVAFSGSVRFIHQLFASLSILSLAAGSFNFVLSLAADSLFFLTLAIGGKLLFNFNILHLTASLHGFPETAIIFDAVTTRRKECDITSFESIYLTQNLVSLVGSCLNASHGKLGSICLKVSKAARSGDLSAKIHTENR